MSALPREFMNRIERRIIRETGLYREEALKVIRIIFDEIAEIVREGKRIAIPRFGAFWCTRVYPRKARNPRTGTTMWTTEKNKIRFRPSIFLKEHINEVDD